MKLNLTSKKILNKKFKKSEEGYDVEEVEKFLEKIALDYREFESMSIEDNSNLSDNIEESASNSDVNHLDNLDLLRKIGKYEKKLYELGVDPTKIK